MAGPMLAGGVRRANAAATMQVMETAFDELDAPIARVCGANVPGPFAGTLERATIPDAAAVARAVRAMASFW